MTDELPKTYDAKTTDAKWLEIWEEKRYFVADPHSKKPSYCIVIPPPNVTGALHMGHALANTLQDILIRWKRMSGFETLWVPGTDHAGISTQTIVERNLMATQNKRKSDIGREAFLKLVWEWKEVYEKRITDQLKKIGSSCDWSRQRFTMDEQNNRAVKTIFKRLFDEGLIYRGDYLVNWDPVTETAIADDEVEYEERSSFLYFFKYPLVGSNETIMIATTRPETMLGDTAVAVHPDDARYNKWIGKKILHPFTNREISLIGDTSIDPTFGTGAVKITPAHDHNDYQMGLTHKLPLINMMTPNGRVNEQGGIFAGLTMQEARTAVIEGLKKLGLFEKAETHINRIGLSYRSKAIVEPYLSKQWFVRMEGFGKKMREAVEKKGVQIIPELWENTYFHWINNLRDWCISRQLWWGHRIPIWYDKEDPNKIICWAGDDLPPEVQKEPSRYTQDPDVLDTWFSSALWPFAALGWPEKTEELKRFYPNSVLVTGHDILFFWVARMILMGEYAMGELPFPKVFLNGLIYGKSYWRMGKEGAVQYLAPEERAHYEKGKPVPKDVFSKWEKMSKTKGNIIDPLEVIEEYGTDAMRIALSSSAGAGAREIDLDLRKFEEYRNFTNKVWNGSRFVFMNLDITPEQFAKGLDEKILALEDHWILSKLGTVIREVSTALDTFAFDKAAETAYNFFWKEFCAFYVEIAKPVLFGKAGTPSDRTNKQILLAIVLTAAIRLLHPMTPFITEEIFSILKEKLQGAINPNADPYTKETLTALSSPHCMVAPYPKPVREEDINPKIEKTFAEVEEILYAIRNIRGEMQVPPGVSVELYLVGAPKEVQQNSTILTALSRISKMHFVESEPQLDHASFAAVGTTKLIIPLPQEMVEQEKKRLEKEDEKLQKQIEKLQVQLENPDFISRAPADLVERQTGELKKLQEQRQAIKNKLI